MYNTEKYVTCSNKMQQLSLTCGFQFRPYEASCVRVGSLDIVYCALLPENGISIEVHFTRQNAFIPKTPCNAFTHRWKVSNAYT